MKNEETKEGEKEVCAPMTLRTICTGFRCLTVDPLHVNVCRSEKGEKKKEKKSKKESKKGDKESKKDKKKSKKSKKSDKMEE